MAKKKSSFIDTLKNLPELFTKSIPYLKKVLSRNPKNPRKETIAKVKSEIRKFQYREAKNSIEKDITDKRQVRKIAQSARSFSPQRFELFTRALEILQPKESVWSSQLDSYKQTVYLSMRNHGISSLQASDEIQALQNGTTTLKQIQELEKQTLRIARVLSEKNNVPLVHILEGMRKSDRTNDDWEIYVKMRKREGWKPRKSYSQMNGEERAHFKEQVKENVYN